MSRQLKIQKIRSCITKINSTLIDDLKDHEIVMVMCNLLEYIQNYCMISGGFGKYCRTKTDYINDSKLYCFALLVVTLSINDDVKL